MEALNRTTDVNSRKNMVGNAIYNYVVACTGTEMAGKVTGMMLDENAV
jgi:hypothetical protein